MTEDERTYLQEIQKFISDKLINQRLGVILESDLKEKKNNACGCFGAWVAVFHNIRTTGQTNEIMFSHLYGAKEFVSNISPHTHCQLRRVADRKDRDFSLFGTWDWDHHPADAIKKLLQQNSKEDLK